MRDMEALRRKVTEIRETNLDSYRVFVVLNYIALIAVIGHLLLIPLFTWLGVGSLVLFNTAGFAIWVLVFFLNREGRQDMAFALGFLATLAQAFVGVAVLGWDGGFHYHVLPTVLLVLIYPNWHYLSRTIAPLLLCSLYIALDLYSRAVGPTVIVDPAILGLLNALNVIVLFLALSALAHKYRVAVRTAEQELEETNRKLDLLAGTDSLTGLLNRRQMRRRIEIEIARSERNRRPFALVMSDIDEFKSFNDRYGHECGDFALVSVANLMKDSMRKQDELARWGGEEFLLLLPETDLEGGGVVAERIREAIEGALFSNSGHKMSITMSFGVSVFDRPQSIEGCINRADRALYAAKRKGKNCTVLSGRESA